MMAGWAYGALFQLMGVFCHQIPERSWFIYGAQLPLCVRCTAITVGALLAAVYILTRRPLPRVEICLLGVAPLALDVVLQVLGTYQGSNTLRAMTGLSFGFFFLIGALSWLAARGGSIQASPSRSSSPS